MIEFRRPRKVVLDDGRLLFGAISQVGDRLVLVSPQYHDHPIDYQSVELRYAGKTVSLQEVTQFVRVETEPCRIYSVDVAEDLLDLEIAYEGGVWRVPVKRDKPPSATLSLMTLFKDDYALIPEFVRYYASLGATDFFLYYNGSLTALSSALLRDCDRIEDVRIVFIECDMRYFWPVERPVYSKSRVQHHAQMVAINHHLHTAKGHVKHTFFVDLDEYVFTPKAEIDAYLESDVFCYVFQCWWAGFVEPVSFGTFSHARHSRLLRVANAGEGHRRTKCLVKLSDVNLMGVHMPHQHVGKGYAYRDGFFHICSFQGADRSDAFLHNSRLWLRDDFIRQRFGEGSPTGADNTLAEPGWANDSPADAGLADSRTTRFFNKHLRCRPYVDAN